MAAGSKEQVQVDELKLRAEQLRKRFDGHARKPVVIEFAGMPKSGKTTIVTEIHRFLKRCRFKTKIITEKATICPIRDKKDSSFNIWTMCQTLSEVIVDTQSPVYSTDPEVLLVDRGLFDAVTWLHLLERLKRLPQTDREAVEKFIMLSEWTKRISQVIVLTVDPGEALKREEGLLPIAIGGSIMNKEVLAQTRDNVLACVDKYEEHFNFNVKVLDTTKKDSAQISRKVAELVLDTIDVNLSEKILHIDASELLPIFGDSSFLTGASAEEVLNLYGKKGRYELRSIVEEDKTRAQALPVLVVRNSRGNLLRLRRKERDPKSSLHNQFVAWAGGHVREEDGTNGKAVIRGLLREAKEELKLNINDDEIAFLGVIWDRYATVKTEKHVALVFEWKAQSDDVEVCLSNSEFYERRGTSLSGTFVPASDWAELEDIEPWSKAILGELLPEKIQFSQTTLL